MGTGVPDLQADHSTSSSSGVKNSWSYTSALPYVFISRSIITHREKFNFYAKYETKVIFLIYENGFLRLGLKKVEVAPVPNSLRRCPGNKALSTLNLGT
jgi:hypothetical protein